MSSADPARAALTLLTVLPVGNAAPSAAATLWFVPVGALVGGVIVVLDMALSAVLPAIVVAPIDLLALALLTGGLHLDGLADSADGLFGGGDAARRLRIMREPAIGAFAVVAVVLVLLVDAAALASTPERATLLWLGAVCSRWTIAVAVSTVPYARSEGLGTSYRGTSGRVRAVVATVTAAVLALPFGIIGAAAMAVAAGLAVLVAARAMRALGGLTGDVYGAMVEITFMGVLVIGVART